MIIHLSAVATGRKSSNTSRKKLTIPPNSPICRLSLGELPSSAFTHNLTSLFVNRLETISVCRNGAIPS